METNAVLKFPISIAGDSIKCFDCSSLFTPDCADEFKNVSVRIVDCAQQQLYDLAPIEYCRKIKYKGERWNDRDKERE